MHGCITADRCRRAHCRSSSRMSRRVTVVARSCLLLVGCCSSWRHLHLPTTHCRRSRSPPPHSDRALHRSTHGLNVTWNDAWKFVQEIQGVPKKLHTKLVALILWNPYRVSKLYCWKISSNVVIKDSTTPCICCHITLWNINARKTSD